MSEALNASLMASVTFEENSFHDLNDKRFPWIPENLKNVVMFYFYRHKHMRVVA